MAWVSAYDDATRDCAFLACAYAHYLRYCSESPKAPVCADSTVTGLCQSHLLHIWKFLYALYQTEIDSEEVKCVLDYVVCELNFATLTWTSEPQSLPALLHCFQRLKYFIQHLKSQLKAGNPSESEKTLDFYLRKQLPALKNDLSTCTANGNEALLLTLVQQLHDCHREAALEVSTKHELESPVVPPAPVSALEEASPLFHVDRAASEPVTPFQPVKQPAKKREKAKVVGPVQELSTQNLMAEMWGQRPSTDLLKDFRSPTSKSKGSVNYTVYKESPAYSSYARQFLQKKSLILDFPLTKVSQSALEDHGNLDQLDQGKWLVPEHAPKSGSRQRGPDKAFTKSATMRQRGDSRSNAPVEPITEELERTFSDMREDRDKSESEVGGEEDGMNELRKAMQGLASLSAKEPEILKMPLPQVGLRTILGRQRQISPFKPPPK